MLSLLVVTLHIVVMISKYLLKSWKLKLMEYSFKISIVIVMGNFWLKNMQSSELMLVLIDVQKCKKAFDSFSSWVSIYVFGVSHDL